MRRCALLVSLFLALLAPFAAAQAWWQADWQYRKPLTVDAARGGAPLSQTGAARTPLLVRLHPGNFAFDGVSPAGTDLRFVAGDDMTVLNHQIERFDTQNGMALVWVDLPALQVGEQTIWMYYGNAKAPSFSQAERVFDPDYVAVYHFSEAGGPPRDATAYANHSSNPLPSAEGVIGQAVRLDGQMQFTLPASQTLATEENGAWTLSLWVKPDALVDGQVLFARRDQEKSLVVGLHQGAPFIEADGRRGVAGTAQAQAGQWSHIAVSFSEGKARAYLNGAEALTMEAVLPALSTPITIGGLAPAEPSTQASGENSAKPADKPAEKAPAKAGAEPVEAPLPAYQSFVGALDELRISRAARSAAAIQADAVSQGVDAALIGFGPDEEAAGLGFGALGFLLGAVALDAWIVMGVLLVMLIASWAVMIGKSRQLTKTERANQRFREAFKHTGDDIGGLAQDGESEAEFKNASLWRIYKTGMEEIGARHARGTSIQAFTPAAVETVYTVMETARAQENLNLVRRLGVLSNAIAGGPYIGLFGTVLGIMVVFLGAAMAGDVNINTVAPGMAAALLATAMGLLVAIPALFGYNRLVARNRNVNTEMNAFVDEFIARLRERAGGAPSQEAVS